MRHVAPLRSSPRSGRCRRRSQPRRMLISARERPTARGRSGSGAGHAERVLASRPRRRAGPHARRRSSTRRSAFGTLLEGGPSATGELMDRCRAGFFVARRDVDVRLTRDEQLAAQRRLGRGVALDLAGVVCSSSGTGAFRSSPRSSGFVVLGADIIGLHSQSELVLEPAGRLVRRGRPGAGSRPGRVGRGSCTWRAAVTCEDCCVTVPNVLATRYAGADLGRIWSPEHKIVLERHLWLAVLRAQRDLGDRGARGGRGGLRGGRRQGRPRQHRGSRAGHPARREGAHRGVQRAGRARARPQGHDLARPDRERRAAAGALVARAGAGSGWSRRWRGSLGSPASTSRW